MKSRELEALESLIEKFSKVVMNATNIPQTKNSIKNCVDYTNQCFKDEINILKSALERLETLEEENKFLRKNNENLDENYFDTWYACERLKENSNYALMFIDDIYCLVNTKDNEFEVIDKYEINSKGIIDNVTKKKLEALEIIKEKKVNFGLLSRCANVERYNKGICYDPRHLTQEEYDLLREML